MMGDSNRADTPETFDPLVTAAERILSGVIGGPIHFTSVERLSEPDRRNLLLRCTSSHTRDLPSQFILKKVQVESYKPEDPDSWDTQRFFNDWVGSEFLSTLGADHGPRFYGGDRELGFILLEDLGHHRSLVEPLLQEGATSAEKSLLRYIARLGRMHADTIRQRSAFEQLFHAVNPTGKRYAPMASELEPFLQRIKTYLEAVGMPAEVSILVWGVLFQPHKRPYELPSPQR